MTLAPVSTLISTYNRATFLRQALNGVLAQTWLPAQIIVVDDGSEDDTASVLEEFEQKITCIRQENSGKSVALNEALRLVNQRFVWVFDDDDIPEPSFIEDHAAALIGSSDAAFTYSPYYIFRENKIGHERDVHVHSLPNFSDNDLFHNMLYGCLFLQQGSLVRTECFKELGGYRSDLKRSLDYEILLKITRKYKGIRVNKPSFYLRCHSGVRGGASEKFEAVRSMQVWHQFNKKIFRELAEDLALREYLPESKKYLFESGNHLTYHLACLERMKVMAKRGIWDIAISDFEMLFFGEEPVKSLDTKDVEEISIYLTTKLGLKDLIRHPSWRKKFGRLVRQCPDSRVRREVGRRLYYSFRHSLRDNEFPDAFAIIRLLLKALTFSDVRAEFVARKVQGA